MEALRDFASRDFGTLTFFTKIKKPKPVSEYLKLQGRFRHLGVEEVDFIQTEVVKKRDRLFKL